MAAATDGAKFILRLVIFLAFGVPASAMDRVLRGADRRAAEIFVRRGDWRRPREIAEMDVHFKGGVIEVPAIREDARSPCRAIDAVLEADGRAARRSSARSPPLARRGASRHLS